MKPNTLGDLFKIILVDYIVVKIRKRSLVNTKIIDEETSLKKWPSRKKLWKRKEANHIEKFII